MAASAKRRLIVQGSPVVPGAAGSAAKIQKGEPWRRISSEMVRLLLAALDGEPSAAVILPTEFVRRESA